MANQSPHDDEANPSQTSIARENPAAAAAPGRSGGAQRFRVAGTPNVYVEIGIWVGGLEPATGAAPSPQGARPSDTGNPEKTGGLSAPGELAAGPEQASPDDTGNPEKQGGGLDASALVQS